MGFFAIPGALVAAARPRNPLGWLMLAVATCFAGTALTSYLVEARAKVRRRMGGLVHGPGPSAVIVPAMLAILLLLPDGHLPTPALATTGRIRPPQRAGRAARARLVPRRGPGGRARHVSVAGRSLPGIPSASCHRRGAASSSTSSWLLQLPLLLGIIAVAARMRRPRTTSGAPRWSTSSLLPPPSPSSSWLAGRCGPRPRMCSTSPASPCSRRHSPRRSFAGECPGWTWSCTTPLCTPC